MIVNNYCTDPPPESGRLRRRRGPKRTVTFDGRTYKVRKDSIEIPDLSAVSRIEALQWLNRETYPTGLGTRTQPNPLAGLGDAVNLDTR